MMNTILYIIKKQSRSIFHFMKGRTLNTLYKHFVHPVIAYNIKIRCGKAKRVNSLDLLKRYNRMIRHKNTKWQNDFYRMNMEAIVHLSEDNNIPQHILITKYDPNTTIIRYKAKNGKQYGGLPARL